MKTPREIAELYRECMEAIRNAIPVDILGPAGDLSPEDYRTMSSTVMIEYNKQEERAAKMNRGGGNYQKPNYPKKEGGQSYGGAASEKQQTLIAELATKIGTDGASAIQQFLDTNEKTSCEELTKSEASSLIDILIPLAPKKPRQGRAPR